jgi:DNA polymerase III subunit beta
MKFTINKDEFIKGLLNVTKIVQPKNVNPILTTVRMILDNSGLNLTGSNGDLAITQTIPLFRGDKEIIRDVRQGGVLVNAKIISDIARKIDGNEITFELIDDSVAKIANEKTCFKLNSIRVEEYQDIDFSKTGSAIKFKRVDYINAINEVAFAAAIKDTRPTLTAINFLGENNTLTLAATDGARLASKKMDLEITNRFNANIPSKALVESTKSLTDEEFVTLYISDKKVLIELKDCEIVSRLISGEYPSIRNIIPKTFYYYLEVNANELINAMDRISLLSNEQEKVVKITMTETKVEVSSSSQQVGSAVETLNVFKYQGERLEISFNSDFVTNAIRSLKSEDVLISFIGEMKPFTVTNKNDSNTIQVITPVRTY